MGRKTIKFEMKGLKKLDKRLKKNVTMDDVKRVVRKNGVDMGREMIRNADFVKGYQTGATKRSIRLRVENDGFTSEVAPTTEYAAYLEHGTRFMDAQPFVKPAWDEQKGKFVKDMKKLVK